MIISCPHCSSENVSRPMADSNEFICQDCGEDFTANEAEDLDDEDEKLDDQEAPFVDMDPETALRMAREVNKNKNED